MCRRTLLVYGSRPDAGVSTAPKVHLDFTPRGARLQIRKQHGDMVSLAEPIIESENKLLRSGVGWDDLKDHYRDFFPLLILETLHLTWQSYMEEKTLHQHPDLHKLCHVYGYC